MNTIQPKTYTQPLNPKATDVQQVGAALTKLGIKFKPEDLKGIESKEKDPMAVIDKGNGD